MTARDNITRARARTPGVVVIPLHGGARSSLRPDTVRDNRWITKCTKGGCKLGVPAGMSGAGLSVRGIQEGTIRNASLPAVSGKTRRTEVRPVKTGVFSRR